MRIHAIQTGVVAIKERQRQGKGHGGMRQLHTLLDPNWTPKLPIYAWVIEHPEGVIVVDTGETARASTPGYFPSWHPVFRFGVREWVHPEEEIGPQLRALGIAPDDVRWLVMTHLHTDHAGGLHHFPRTERLVSRAELTNASGFAGQVRGYLPNRWPADFATRAHAIDFRDTPFGSFPQSYPLTQASDVVLVPTPGHSPGHLSVILQEGEQAIFFAGDTSYTEELMLAQVVDGVSPDERAAKQTLAQIVAFARETPTVYLPAHDPESAQRLTARQPVSSSQLAGVTSTSV